VAVTLNWFKVDDESEPSKGIENANKIGSEETRLMFSIGTVHSGVQMGIHKVARDSRHAHTHSQCRRSRSHTCIVCTQRLTRTSFSNSQPTLALGQAMVAKGHKKAVWITWKYAAGDEAYEGFKVSYTKAGGTIVERVGPGPSLTSNSKPYSTENRSTRSLTRSASPPLALSGAKFMKDFAAAGLKGKIALYGSGFSDRRCLGSCWPRPQMAS
jgi:branched-chain amino acid transport system substrate-binding protein